jgi:hypothetical protein
MRRATGSTNFVRLSQPSSTEEGKEDLCTALWLLSFLLLCVLGGPKATSFRGGVVQSVIERAPVNAGY